MSRASQTRPQTGHPRAGMLDIDRSYFGPLTFIPGTRKKSAQFRGCAPVVIEILEDLVGRGIEVRLEFSRI